MTFEDRHAGKQHLMRDQPGCGPVEQRAGSVGAGPAQGIEPAVQPEPGERVRKIDEAAIFTDLGTVVPPSLAGAVVVETATEVRNLQLPREGGNDARRRLG